MSNRYNTENTDRSEAAHCRAEGCCYCSFRQVPCSCHQKKKKKSIYLSSEYIVHFEAFLPLGVTESLIEAELVSTLMAVNNALVKAQKS